MSKISTTKSNKEQNKTGGGGKCHSPLLIHGNIITCGVGRPRNIVMWTEGLGKFKGRRR